MSAKGVVVQDMLFIDMMSPDGHIRLNRFYMSQLAGPGARIYISDDLAGLYDGFDTRSLGAKPCGPEITERITLARRVVGLVRRESPKSVVLLSYDLATFPFVSRMLSILGVTVFCFEHNTAPNRKIRRWLHTLTATNVKRFVYTPYLQELYQRLGLHAIYVPHPCLSWDIVQTDSQEWYRIRTSTKERFNRVGFCPSDSVPLTQIEAIARTDPDTLFVCKTTSYSDLHNVVTHRYFDDYGSALAQCDFVAVPFANDHKVSGPVFEAIATGKQVMLLDNRFGRYVKSLFPGAIFFPGEVPLSEPGVIDLARYNQSGINLIMKALAWPHQLRLRDNYGRDE